ncbi:MAG TPA: glycosyltransferase family protein [Opitutaceae bacterium]|nr:glycosyltransferase family protein [Lacunisphaera sp.]HWA09181.1 glycosyltransferase family protein [Opitutaceae bacterium]
MGTEPTGKKSRPLIAAIIQARMGSSRLPGKSLCPIGGQPLLGHIIDRLKACRLLDKVVVATTTAPEDDALAAYAAGKSAGVFRGGRDDVLDRYFRATQETGAEVVIRITADDPFKDPEVIDQVTACVLGNPDLDYASNTLQPTFPEGLDVEVFRASALTKAWREAKLPSEREHVTPYIWKNPGIFRIENIRHAEDLSGLRWTIDYPEDLVFARAVYENLHVGNRIFLMDEILALLERQPQIGQINAGIRRNEGYLLSIQRESPKNKDRGQP